MSSPVTLSSIAGAESLDSDAVSLLRSGSDKGKPQLSKGITRFINNTRAATESHQIPEDTNGNKLFTLGDGDFDLCVDDTVFHTHKYLLKRFSVLKHLIEQKATGHGTEVLSVEHNAVDFANTFKILYASPIEGVPDFDSTTLVSALRVATAYDYPALRTFSVKRLESSQLSAIERIRIAREFEFTSWEAPAYEELCGRDEPITEEEADVLGMSAFVQVAKIREKEQRRKGYEARSKEEELDEEPDEQVQSHQPALDEQSSSPVVLVSTPMSKITKKKARKAKAQTVENMAYVAIANGDKADDSDVTPSFKPRITGASSEHPGNVHGNVTISGSLQYKIPGCQCRSPSNRCLYAHNGNYVLSNSKCDCTTSPCVADALSQLQASQIAHNASITQLESVVQGIKSGLTHLEHSRDMGDVVAREPAALTTVQIDVREWLAAKSGVHTD